MFLSKKKGGAPAAPRSNLDATARVHGSPGQRIFAIMVALGATAVIFGAVGYFYLWPAWQAAHKSETSVIDSKDPEVKVEAPKLTVPLDPADATPAANGDTTDDAYKKQPGLAGDAKPSSAPANQGHAPAAATSAQVGIQGRGTPPGMSGQQGEEQAYAQAALNGPSDTDKARARKLDGELGYFGDKPEPARAERVSAPRNAEPQAQYNEACSGITGGQDVVAECNRRVSAAQPAAPAQVRAPAPAPAPATPQNQLAAQLTPIQTPNGTVGIIPHPHLTLQKGEPMTCTLDTAIQTDQFGFVECVTDFPLMSMDGKVVLAERGTVITGEYSRDLAPGANSIFILWTRGTTPAPYHVYFDLNSPGSDRLGRSGITGDVDDKFWERYKGALMFSVIQDASAAIAARASGQGGSTGGVVILPNTQNAGQNAVAELLKQGADVKRSLYRNQGDTIAITVARYIDFSSVYKLRATKGGRNE